MNNRPRNADPGPLTDTPGPLPEPLELGRGRTAVRLELLRQGRDLLVRITGGEAHVGAVAASDGRDPAPGAAGDETVRQVPGHKEGPLAGEAARRLARAAGCTCAAVVGIHQDQATPAEIAAIVANVRQGLAEFEAQLAPEDSA